MLRFTTRLSITTLIAIGLLSAGFATSASADPVIVILKPGANPSAHAKRHGVETTQVYDNALNGYAANITAAGKGRLAKDAAVLDIVADTIVTIAKPYAKPSGGSGGTTAPPQVTPFGIQRAGGLLSPSANIDGIDMRVNVDVAVIDTGIATHPDLNVVGGVACNGTNWKDGNGHGTHVAGTIGAKDDAYGVVGVAPGARLWAVRVLNSAGSGWMSQVLCGIDWVAARSSTIEVANMSLGGPGTDPGACPGTTADPEHFAICRLVANGVPVAVAAGNETDDAANSTPAAYDAAITVSALADFDGLEGGLGAATCRADEDDTFANFSNYGEDVDIIAPGVCIKSTWKSGYNTISGTSMASPHVAGALALLAAADGAATPAQLKASLLDAADDTVAIAGDPDDIQEPLLDLSTL
jgi:subtilisin family serine protease